MVKFEDLVGKFIVSTILILSMFSLIIVVQSENNAVDPLENDETFNDTFFELIASIDNSTETSQEKYDVFNTEEPKGGLAIVLLGIVSVGKSFSNIIFSFFTVIIKLPLVVLGIDPNVYNLILSWLIILAVVAAWFMYKFGG